MNHPSMPAARKPRIVIAGQVPPPFGGQNVMIARILGELAASDRFEGAHLVFHFTPDFKTVRRGSAAKVIELVKVVGRLLALRARGPIDLLLFPAGGPQTVPLIRDLLLLPWVLLLARRVVVQFHAAGVAERGGWLVRALGALYRRCFAAIVMTPFNRRDPQRLGIPRIEVIPHQLPDEYDAKLVRRDEFQVRLLYVGHLCPDKGTPALLRALKIVAERNPRVVLELVGETLPPSSDEDLRAMVRSLGLEDRVQVAGLLTGRAKLEAFARADLFVFPSVAPYESFGLVMVEAMMWGLPIVATDWRGNRDVLGGDFDGECFPVGEDFAASLAGALGRAVEALRAKSGSSGRNRQLYLERYRSDPHSLEYPRVFEQWLTRDPG